MYAKKMTINLIEIIDASFSLAQIAHNQYILTWQTHDFSDILSLTCFYIFIQMLSEILYNYKSWEKLGQHCCRQITSINGEQASADLNRRNWPLIIKGWGEHMMNYNRFRGENIRNHRGRRYNFLKPQCHWHMEREK